MVYNTTFNYISAISWRSVLFVEETGVTGENHRPAASHWQTLSHNAVSSTPAWARFELTTLVLIGTESKVVVNPTTMRSRLRRPPFHAWKIHFNRDIALIQHHFESIAVMSSVVCYLIQHHFDSIVVMSSVVCYLIQHHFDSIVVMSSVVCYLIQHHFDAIVVMLFVT